MYNKVFMLEALSQAACSAGWPFGAVIECNGQFISKASNRVVIDHDPTAHAEILAIREACRVLKTHDLHGCELYSSSMPCPMCLAAIKWAKIDKVYFAAKTTMAESIGFDDARMWIELREPFATASDFDCQAIEGWCEAAAREIMLDWKDKHIFDMAIKFLNSKGEPLTDIPVGITCPSECGYYYIRRASEHVYRVADDFSGLSSFPTFKEAVMCANNHARTL